MNNPFEPTQKLLPSLLDRLLDDEPQNLHERRYSQNQSEEALEKSVKRDLENLLNTRRRCGPCPPELKELEDSLVNYGLPDFLAMNLAFDEGRQLFRRMIEKTIRSCEPRLVDVKVTMLDVTEPIHRNMRFRIDAKLRAEPAPEPISFDSVLEPVTCNFTLERSGHGG
jgi:type VI secretion system protein ImpF